MRHPSRRLPAARRIILHKDQHVLGAHALLVVPAVARRPPVRDLALGEGVVGEDDGHGDNLVGGERVRVGDGQGVALDGAAEGPPQVEDLDAGGAGEEGAGLGGAEPAVRVAGRVGGGLVNVDAKDGAAEFVLFRVLAGAAACADDICSEQAGKEGALDL